MEAEKQFHVQQQQKNIKLLEINVKKLPIGAISEGT